MNDRADDYWTEGIRQWLMVEHELPPKNAVVFSSGIQVGLALADRHREEAALLYEQLRIEGQIKLAGSMTAFQAQAVASGDERMAAEKMADELADFCPEAP